MILAFQLFVSVLMTRRTSLRPQLFRRRLARVILRSMSGPAGVHDYGSDIYTEADGSDDTLANLGPLRPLAGIWTSADGTDVHPVGPGSDVTGPVVDGDEHNVFVERYELYPIDPQTNGPQLFYGMRYHT